MQKLYKQLEEWVTKWESSYKNDEFFVARIRLTFYYSLTAIIILISSSIALYNSILSNLIQSIIEREFDIEISQALINKAKDILLNRFATIDAIIVFFVVIVGFFLTYKTLKPIKTSMQKQKRFIADASHEIRTPIAVIISGLEVNLNNKDLNIISARKTLENTLAEMREFSKLSNDLLDISKYDAPMQTKHEPLAINELVKSVLAKNKNLAKLKNINIKTNIKSEILVKGNRSELSRVFFNILDNAIKYTPNGGVISVSDKISSGKYILSINDNGEGIREDIIKRIFEPFFRGDISRNTNGAGLGLTLSKKIIENHKGIITIQSKVGEGANVEISLPISS